MPAIEIIALLALLQFVFFGIMVGRAREQYGIKAPAVTGNEHFERAYRVQMNTLEQLILFLPALWLAAGHVREIWILLLGSVYLIGRMIYWRSYVADPATRSLGFGLSMAPILALLLIGLIGATVQLLRT